MDNDQALNTARILHEALPYLRRFSENPIVIKIGGSVLVEPRLLNDFCQDAALMQFMGLQLILVHGGGPHISAALEKAGIQSHFEGGQRVTDHEALAVVEQALAEVNARLLSALEAAGARVSAFADSAVSPIVGRAVSADDRRGDIGKILLSPFRRARRRGEMPMLSPMGRDRRKNALNINADVAAGHIAKAVGAGKLMLLTDVSGIQRGDELISALRIDEVQSLIDDGTIAGGMLPKVRCVMHALQNGVAQAHIIDGRLQHAALLEVFTSSGVGTLISAD